MRRTFQRKTGRSHVPRGTMPRVPVRSAGFSVQLACRVALAAAALLAVFPALPNGRAVAQTPDEPVVVASKPFAESLILGEVFAQLLEASGRTVDHRPGLGSTEITFQAVRADEVDVYPEYTGTGLLVLLGESAPGSAARAWERVAEAFRAEWGVRWLAPLGFENTYAVAVRRVTADSLGLETLSDLAGISHELEAGFTPDFMGRDDGLPGLEGAYGMSFGSVRPLMQAVKYRALLEGAVDVIDGYSTDGALDRDELVVLRDDRGFFPPYEAAPLVSRRLAERDPGALVALGALAGRISVERMRRANRQAEVDGVEVSRVAAELLRDVGLGPDSGGTGLEVAATESAGVDAGADGDTGSPRSRPGNVRDGRPDGARIRRAVARLGGLAGEHMLLVCVSLAGALLLAVPAGLALSGGHAAAEPVLRTVGVLQTIPSIALLAFMIPILGIGAVPAVVALFLYSLLPILRNTVTGLDEADPDAAEAGRALGMTRRQVLMEIRLPLAAPVIMAGIRTAAVINVGTATLAAFIGAGGLGEPIVAGLALSDNGLILSGAIPAALLALVVDAVLGRVQRRLAPGGMDELGA